MEASESTINAPHPDEGVKPDDADLFFGGDGEEATNGDAALPDPDPETFNPETGSFDTPDGETPDVTEEQAAAAEAETNAALEQQAKLRAIAEREAAEKAAADEAAAAAAEATPEPEPETPAAEVAADVAPSEADAPADPSADPPAEGAKQSGALEREYIVFQKIPLTEKVLKHLLAQIEAGKQGEPRVGYFELHRCEARNVNGAIAAAYTKHQKVLGEKADMAAVSSRSFQEKHVEPKQTVETNLSIT